MGALHDGHLSLIRKSVAECQTNIISLFVNPLQFGPQEDLSRYPRQEAEDLALAEAAGADFAFAPSVEELLPTSQAAVHVPRLSERWEGRRRPGHFEGVATIVAKLFNIISPGVAYFGLKDFQQCAVVQAMVTDLNFPIALRFGETVREADGLAMSSRNRYLSEDHRAVAPQIYATLLSTKSKLADAPVSEALTIARQHLESLGFEVDYFALVDRFSLEPTEVVDQNGRLIVAAKLANTWLLDNLGL